MGSDKLPSESVTLAITAATNALSTEPSFAWIRRSCLIERAYFLGLLNGLDPIADERDLSRLLATIVTKTMWPRSADDSFRETELNKDLEKLQAVLNDLSHRVKVSDDPRRVIAEFDAAGSLRELTGSISNRVGLLNERWESALHAATELIELLLQTADRALIDGMNSTSSANLTEQLHRIRSLVSGLEEPLRHLTLLETHHELSKTLGD